MDLPTVAPYFFVPPAWADAEACAMLDGMSIGDYQNTIRGTAERLKSTAPWDRQTLTDSLHAQSRTEAIKTAKFMTALRHALSGVKVPFVEKNFVALNLNRSLPQNGPSVAEMMDVLGEQRTIARLEEAGDSSHAWFTTTSPSNSS